jgi:hypothetical protein
MTVVQALCGSQGTVRLPRGRRLELPCVLNSERGCMLLTQGLAAKR